MSLKQHWVSSRNGSSHFLQPCWVTLPAEGSCWPVLTSSHHCLPMVQFPEAWLTTPPNYCSVCAANRTADGTRSTDSCWNLLNPHTNSLHSSNMQPQTNAHASILHPDSVIPKFLIHTLLKFFITKHTELNPLLPNYQELLHLPCSHVKSSHQKQLPWSDQEEAGYPQKVGLVVCNLCFCHYCILHWDSWALRNLCAAYNRHCRCSVHPKTARKQIPF